MEKIKDKKIPLSSLNAGEVKKDITKLSPKEFISGKSIKGR